MSTTGGNTNRYRGRCGEHYIRPAAWSFDSIPVLEFLNGLPYNDLALNYIHALRPSSVRVTTGEVTSDAVSWRVTVTVHPDGDAMIIDSIEQEVEVGLSGGFRNGYDLRCALGRLKG